MKKYELYFIGNTSTLEDRGFVKYTKGDVTYERDNVCIYEEDGYVSLFYTDDYSGAILAYLIDRDFVWQTEGVTRIISQRFMIDMVTGDVVDLVEGYAEDRYVRVNYEFSESFIERVLDLYNAGELALIERV